MGSAKAPGTTPIPTTTPPASLAPLKPSEESGDGSTNADVPSPALAPFVETPAPTMEGAVAELSGAVSAPRTVLGSPASSLILSTELRELMKLEDQDRLVVTIAPTKGTRQRKLSRNSVSNWFANEQVAFHGERKGNILLNRGSDFHWKGFRIEGRAEKKRKGANANPAADVMTSSGGEHYHGRSLADEFEFETAMFTVIFINDPGETAAYGRGTDAAVKLLEGREVCSIPWVCP